MRGPSRAYYRTAQDDELKQKEDWQPELYNRFRNYRAEPVSHILERLQIGERDRIIDLGCGSGENTIELARRSPNGNVTGIDGSPAMIDAAKSALAAAPAEVRSRVTFEVGDVAKFRANKEFDLIFSNATFQWIKDQRALFAACLDALKPGGQIVVQIPANEIETGKVEMFALAETPRWKVALGGLNRPFPELPPDHYARMLTELGYVSVDCYYHVFRHPMERAAEVAEWYRATGLRPFMDALPAERRDQFLAEYVARLEQAYGTSGAVTFTFRRLFMRARRPG